MENPTGLPQGPSHGWSLWSKIPYAGGGVLKENIICYFIPNETAALTTPQNAKREGRPFPHRGDRYNRIQLFYLLPNLTEKITPCQAAGGRAINPGLLQLAFSSSYIFSSNCISQSKQRSFPVRLRVALTIKPQQGQTYLRLLCFVLDVVIGFPSVPGFVVFGFPFLYVAARR